MTCAVKSADYTKVIIHSKAARIGPYIYRINVQKLVNKLNSEEKQCKSAKT